LTHSNPTTERRETGAASLARIDDYYLGRFAAMASPCEVLIDTDDRSEAEALVEIAELEARRIERKFSRYRSGNIVHRINRSAGRPIQVDEETALLLAYATACYEMSDGKFDITSGVLRRVWQFDGSDRVPAEAAVRKVLRHVGWRRVTWHSSTLTMPAGMEIDLGGLGKEYAVERATALLAARTGKSFLVNFGGDLYASGWRRGQRAWGVGVDDPERTGQAASCRIDLSRGGLATTGDARRFVLWKGRRLGHILDPKTGWPVQDAPRAVTVLARTCLEAGTLSTLAYLQGPRARDFLQEQGVRFWIA
jgi:thiamine biosynthesis lipoprotein